MVRNTSYDTRALVRAAFPLILADGENPTSDRLRQKIRETHPDLAQEGFNPSDATINDEVKKIRRELGASMSRAAALPGLPKEIAGPAGEFINRMLDFLRGQVREEFEGERAKLAQDRESMEKDVARAQSQAAEASQRLDDAQRQFDVTLAEVRGEATLAATQRDSLRDELAAVQAQLAAANAGLSERAAQIARLETDLDNNARRFEEQMQLAEERYRGLEQAKLMELEQARQAKEQAHRDVDELKGQLHQARERFEAQGEELLQANRQVSELTGEVRALRSADEVKGRQLQELESGRRQADLESGRLTERLSTLEASVPGRIAEAIEGEKSRLLKALKAALVPLRKAKGATAAQVFQAVDQVK